jgi:RNA polymerase-binding transcription factor DksA
MTMTDHHKKTQLEDEYFVREDAEKKRKLAIKLQKETQDEELARLKALHYMRCPKCGLPLQEMKLRRLDVDVCFACHGVFLDRGELEHIVKDTSPGVMDAILNWFKGETRG